MIATIGTVWLLLACITCAWFAGMKRSEKAAWDWFDDWDFQQWEMEF